MNEIIPNEAINEGLSNLLSLLPIPFILIVMMVVIGFGLVRFNGEVVKFWIIYTILIIIALAGLAYILIPDDEILMVREASTLVISSIASIFFLRLFIFWRKNKTKKK